MARQVNKLSNASLAKLGEGMHGDGLGLWLQVRATGRSWIMRFTLGGRARAMGLGPLHTIGLADARDRARRARALILDGVDPIEARRVTRLAAKRQAARAKTFKACAEAYLAQHRAAWRNPKHAAQWSSTLQRYVYPVLGDATVDAVDVELVLEAVEPIWNTKPETAGRVRGRIETILDWATARGYRQGENPARWRGHLENLLPARGKVRRVAHHPALPFAQIGAFIAELRRQEGVAARALEFAILTAARTGEVIGARWSEISLGDRVWTIPADRMKAGKEHRVPLSDAACALLETVAAQRTGEFVFPGARAKRPLSNMALAMVLRRMSRDEITVHGFRSTFADWAAESSSFPREVVEMGLAHALASKVEAAYRRGDLFDKRRQLMAAWAAYCTTDPAAKVVPRLRSSAAAGA